MTWFGVSLSALYQNYVLSRCVIFFFGNAPVKMCHLSAGGCDGYIGVMVCCVVVVQSQLSVYCQDVSSFGSDLHT